MKILNLYAGIGGNRKLWGDDHDITAVEINPDIAKIYSDFFTNDTMIVGDAHQYLLDHIQDDWDFIWSSPPCPTHSRMNNLLIKANNQIPPRYPDMKLYEEIILIKYWSNCKYAIENVVSYYDPLIAPQELFRHYYWANFFIRKLNKKWMRIKNKKGDNLAVKSENMGVVVKNWYDYKGDKRQIINNCVDPDLGLHILKCSQEKELELRLG